MFFFFKQKTAYELRISDWRSDVCSSDLFGRKGLDGASTRGIAKAAGTAMSSITYHYGGKEGLYLAAADYIVSQMDDGAHPIEGDELGRASCRDRVCQ